MGAVSGAESSSGDTWGRLERLRPLRRRFVEEAERDVREIARILAQAAGAPPTGETGKRLRKLAHDLHGSGGGYGFPDVSARARELETAFLKGLGGAPLAAAAAALERAVREAVEAVGT